MSDALSVSAPRQLFLFLIFHLAPISNFRWRFFLKYFSAFLKLHAWQPPMLSALRNGVRCYSYIFSFGAADLEIYRRPLIFYRKKLAAAKNF